MQHYTTIEQNKKLLELGLSSESADMYYFRQIDVDYFPPNIESILPIPLYKNGKEDFNYDTPCWSLGALLEVMPQHIDTPKEKLGLHIFHVDGRWNFEYGYFNNSYSVLRQDKGLLNAAYNMVVWLLENGYIKKGE